MGADIHVCLGPWYALRENVGSRVFYLDRAFWGDPDSVSLCWLDGEGRKQFNWDCTAKRAHPELMPWKSGNAAVVLCDYGMTGELERNMARPMFSDVTIRRHPSESTESEPLSSCLNAHQVAIGRHSTAMVEAAINGLAIVCRATGSPVSPIAGKSCCDIQHRDRENWINALAWHNWTLADIESGDAWQHLNQ